MQNNRSPKKFRSLINFVLAQEEYKALLLFFPYELCFIVLEYLYDEKKNKIGREMQFKTYLNNEVYEESYKGVDSFGEKFQMTYIHKKEHGVSKKWFRNGRLFYRRYYKRGKPYGKWEGWYDNGQLKYQEFYKDGQKHGKWRGWHKNGKLYYYEIYNQGKKQGVSEGWYENGQQKFRENHVDDKQHGEQKSWYKNILKNDYICHMSWYKNGYPCTQQT